MNSKHSNKYLLAIGLTLVLLAHLFVFTPLTLFGANADEFVSSFWDIVTVGSLPALLIFIVLLLVGWLLKGQAYSRYLVFIATLGLLVWLQGSVLVWDYGVLDGRSIDWSQNNWHGWVDLSIWVVAIALGLVFYRAIGQKIIQFAFLIFGLQLLLSIYAVVEEPDTYANRVKVSSSPEALAEIYQFSSKHNIVHLFVDGFQADVFEELVTKFPKLRAQLAGFEFYPEALGVFPYTRFAVPAFMSGKVYQNEATKDEFIKTTLKEKSITNSAYENGYEVDIVGEQYWTPIYSLGKHDNSYIINRNFHSSAADLRLDNGATLLDLTMFRVVPHFLKRFVYNDQRWLINPMLSDKQFLNYRYFAHTAFMNQMVEDMSVGRDKPVYKFIHIMNTHNPMVVGKDCNYVGGVVKTTRSSLSVQSLCTMVTVARFFEKLKELGVYDDSLIVLHADHGGWVKPYRFTPHVVADKFFVTPSIGGLATPLIAIKRPKAVGDLKVSSKLASLLDLPDTISDIQGWDESFGGTSLLQLKDGETRERRFYFYEWQRDAWEAEHTGPIYEFVVRGSLYEGPWLPGRIFLPPGE